MPARNTGSQAAWDAGAWDSPVNNVPRNQDFQPPLPPAPCSDRKQSLGAKSGSRSCLLPDGSQRGCHGDRRPSVINSRFYSPPRVDLSFCITAQAPSRTAPRPKMSAWGQAAPYFSAGFQVADSVRPENMVNTHHVNEGSWLEDCSVPALRPPLLSPPPLSPPLLGSSRPGGPKSPPGLRSSTWPRLWLSECLAFSLPTRLFSN